MNKSSELHLIPNSFAEACEQFRKILKDRKCLDQLDRQQFLQGWWALFYIAPGLHPDEFDNPDGAWPEHWKGIAGEAFKRGGSGELSEGQLYPAESQHAALCMPRRGDACIDI